ncbi:isochorismate synthase [Parabacteroides sp. GYB001]|uniref:isochorismate synthase n=1 Tax=Parabacteroides leei TaxID=2939491 RepID=UPI002017CC0E|nr:isochorismate synthase [Parabacteroides leei]MCL3852259.1 isochorismate synthase [Parabacteroides leei]
MIDSLIRQGRSFAIYRIPGEEIPRFVMQASGSPRLFSNIEELNEQQGFVIAPFRPGRECPIVLIRPDYSELPENSKKGFFPMDPEFHSNETENASERKTKDNYIHCFDAFIKPLQENTLDKLVLSRSLTLDREASFSPAKAFYKACRRYIRSYVYLCHTPQTGTWLGSTPEIILSGEKGEWHTVALAGTQPLQNGKLPTHWDDKNRKEQQLVSTYIHDRLSSQGINLTMEGPYPARAGALCHLKSDFRFRLEHNDKLGDLLALLHPTPAVCGLPKEEAYQFILENEGYDRRYYSGFIGRLNPKGRTDLYVNLRCMNISEQLLTLYAGGGLLSSSEPADEWQETEDKLQTMRALL